MRSTAAGFASLLLYFLYFLEPAQAQTSAVRSLGPAVDVAPEAFTLIKGLRELQDGRVIVTDWIEQRLVLVDFSRDLVRDIGRQGSGPSEFRLPGELVAMPGDSTLMIDFGNTRLAVIGPDLTITRTISMGAHGERWGMVPRSVDGQGTFYFTVSPFAVGRGAPADSVPVVRWREGHAMIERVPGALVKTSTPRTTPSMQMNIPFVVFAKQDGWVTTSEGWTAVVRSEPYRVDWFGPSGERRVGEVIDHQPIRVSMEDRRNFVRTFLASSMMSGRGSDGGMGLVSAAAQSDEEVNRIARDGSFAEEFPPFEPGKIWVDVRGRIWVQRAGPAGQPVVLDVFDRSAGTVSSYSIEAGREVLGLGQDVVYATVADADDLLRLERYRVPE